uniref:Uncharacterized protein n=1 Tax=Amblyomma tuberculatum TaxID=48802 RepID=A0A6M2E4K0_9ACAR
MGLGAWLRQTWKMYPEIVIMGTVATIMAPIGTWCAYQIHLRPWHYRREYTVIRDDEPYAQVLKEAYKSFVPHKPPT